ncbi:Rad2 nuclease [Cyanidiococcus yangmingshanensis]|uniref:Rad2 nuclease n=1 Tax=Cyanidiococcus yangmingshanensis TaxID=2690220 RepID=A0A7J7IEZ3_9RHOD|nr:Rad2 nuclease [Cyanidiococcus yangmingshanensis]
MGIQGLLPVLKPICFRKHISEFAESRAGVDGYSWLHKSVVGCAFELCTSPRDTATRAACSKRYAENFLSRVRMLRHYGIVPLIVFDGGRLPAKCETEQRRAAQRQRNLELGNRELARGDVATAQSFFQRAVDVTPEMAYEVIKALRAENIDYVVAPYEADAQLAMLSKKKDSDLIVYGARSVLFKLDRYGYGEYFEQKNLGAVSNPNLLAFNPDMLLFMCILAGCDFFAGIPKMGIRRAHSFVLKCRQLDQILQAVRSRRLHENFAEFEHGFRRAVIAFRHHRVFDPRVRRLTYLNPLPPGIQDSEAAGVLGPNLDPQVAVKIATAELCPLRLVPFVDEKYPQVAHNLLSSIIPISKRELFRTGGRAFWDQVQIDVSQSQSKILPRKRRTEAIPPLHNDANTECLGTVEKAILSEKLVTPEEPQKKLHRASACEDLKPSSNTAFEYPDHEGMPYEMSTDAKQVVEEQPLCSLCSSMGSQPISRNVALSPAPSHSPKQAKPTIFLYENEQPVNSLFVQNTPEQACGRLYSPSVASTVSPK